MRKLIVSVEFNNSTIKLKATSGENLFELLSKNGIAFDCYCGGNGACNGCKVIVDGEKKPTCQTIITKDVDVIIASQKNEVYDCKKIGRYSGGDVVIAVDIGTTTVEATLMEDGRQIAVITLANSQKSYGADVISRIKYSAKDKKNLDKLQKAIVSDINEIIDGFKSNYPISSIKKMVVAGNTVMLHLLLNKDCESMGYSPYTPRFTASQEVSADKLGIDGTFILETLPCISSFVGADIVSDLIPLKIPEIGKSLLIDLGTNAEIVLFDKIGYICTSTSAGPCFEGANISCGMRASDGAISSFKLEKGTKVIEVIGGGKAKGLCATGLIDVIAELVSIGYIDGSGKLANDDGYAITEGIILSQNDIREFQKAKSAVYSGIEILLESTDTKYEEIETLFIAGGFNSIKNKENFANSGIIPKQLIKKCQVVPDGCLQGMIKYINCGEKSDMIDVIIGRAKNVDLSLGDKFVEKYIDNMRFSE